MKTFELDDVFFVCFEIYSFHLFIHQKETVQYRRIWFVWQ